MNLYIAEKPSLGRAVAKALGITKTHKTHIETKGGIVTWCFGHLYEQANPDHYDPANKKWSMDTLPIVPQKWVILAKKDAKAQISSIRNLMQNATTVINCGDPDREGQLLVDELLEELKWSGKTQRAWLKDLTDSGVKKSLSDLKDNREFLPMSDSAKARSRADWLIGMNLTRAYTILNNGEGVLSVGRVQTPTLNLVVERDLSIENFKPVSYWTMKAMFSFEKGDVAASWVLPASVADDQGRCLNKEKALAVYNRLSSGGSQAIVLESIREEKKESAPLPFALSDLQQYASNRWGYGAQKILDIAQSLYEKHKATTYPRSDCGYLSEAQHTESAGVLNQIAVISNLSRAVAKADVSIKSRAFNDKKVGAHTGIIPTGEVPRGLSAEESNVFEAICLRYLAQFYPSYIYEAARMLIECNEEKFKATGKVDKDLGWKALYKSDSVEKESDDVSLPNVRKDDVGALIKLDPLKEEKTKPPTPFNEGALIKAMSGIAKFVDDPAAKKMLKGTEGIGTEATRAGIIETLKKRGFLISKGKKLTSSPQARAFIKVLPKPVKDPVTTALWETGLEQIEQGKLSLDEFLSHQELWLEEQIALAKSGKVQIFNGVQYKCPSCGEGVLKKRKSKKTGKVFWGCSRHPECNHISPDAGGKPGKPISDAVLGQCQCGADIKESPKAYCCVSDSCKATVWKTMSGKRLSQKDALALLQGKTIHVKNMKSKAGKKFDADVYFDFDEKKTKFNFGDKK